LSFTVGKSFFVMLSSLPVGREGVAKHPSVRLVASGAVIWMDSSLAHGFARHSS